MRYVYIQNTLGHKKMLFEPLKAGHVSIYLCGPTVYDVAHLGHGRCITVFDMIRRFFEYLGYKVSFASNYTDIDDKMILRANERGIDVAELSAELIPAYEEDFAKLNVKPLTFQPRATENIDTIIELISKLEQGGYTYVLSDGVYFNVAKFPSYGKLSGQKLEELKMGARVDVNEEKLNSYDFALWKFKKEGEPSWKSPWGDGRPGWHIECSAMSYKIFGEKFDIHAGGLDLVFPHHECEIAQSTAVFGEDSFANYWLHNGFINFENQKMSKSLGNFFTLRDMFEKYAPLVIRFLYLQTHYQNPINFTVDLLNQAKSALLRVHDFIRRLDNFVDFSDFSCEDLPNAIEKAKEGFEKCMCDDFDSSGALGFLFDFIGEINSLIDKKVLSSEDVSEITKFLHSLDTVFAFIFTRGEILPEDIEALIEKRNIARKEKNYVLADEIRDNLLSEGIILEDTPNGVVWKKK